MTKETTRLNSATRQAALAAMSASELDILVIGGGITGAGISLDAASRGLKTGIVEAGDWARGTSSRSSRLVHGGLRYLYNLDFKLVAESLKERGLLLDKIAPHLVTAQPFLWPLKTPVIERIYSAVGVGMYDAIAYARAGRRTVPFQQHLSRAGTKEVFPDARADAMVGSIRFYDARVDDARLVLTLLRTAAGFGAHAASHVRATEFTHDATGRVTGAVVRDALTGETHTIRAKHVISATGVWTEGVQQLAGAEGGLRVLASKGIHLIVARDRIAGEAGMFLRTEKSVLFIIPWPDYWVIGTTDTPWHEELDRPVATARDIDYVLEQANSVLTSKLTRDDVLATSAGLRPLLQPGTKNAANSAKVSREHTVAQATPGLTTIAGGKLTTYRVMAKDAVDFVLGSRAASQPSITAELPLHGAAGLDEIRAATPALAAKFGLTEERLERLISRYGSATYEVLELIEHDPTLAQPLAAAATYLRAEIAHAVTHEGAFGLTDVLLHRARLATETKDRGLESLPEVAEIVAPLLGWDQSQTELAQEDYRVMVANLLQAEQQHEDAAAVATLSAGLPETIEAP